MNEHALAVRTVTFLLLTFTMFGWFEFGSMCENPGEESDSSRGKASAVIFSIGALEILAALNDQIWFSFPIRVVAGEGKTSRYPRVVGTSLAGIPIRESLNLCMRKQIGERTLLSGLREEVFFTLRKFEATRFSG